MKLKEVLDISPVCDTHTHTYMSDTQARTHSAKQHICARTRGHTSALHPFDTNTFKALPNPPTTPSISHSLALPNSISLFLSMHMVQKLYFWLTRLEHKSSSYASWRNPTREASIPSWTEETGLVLFFSHYHFHTGLSHLAFGCCVLYFPPTSTPCCILRA